MTYWEDDALCAEIGSDFWFPNKGENNEEAMAICNRCPVIVECRDYALADTSLMGIWGGTSWNDRVRMRREARKAG